MARLDHSDRHDAGLSQALAKTRELVREASKLLCDQAPDTFLGRKTQDPFPAEQTTTVNLRNSRRPR